MQDQPLPDARKKTLSGNRQRRSRLLCLLYFSQGTPWGFATIALLATLSEAGHSKADTATVVAMAILPWTFKFVWGPVIDSYRMPAFGIRRPWIAIAQLFMAVTLIGAATQGALSSESTLIYLAWVFFVHNCFASLQDVATDAMAVDLLEPNERGRVNGYMWGSKLAGIAVGGAGMAWVISATNIQTAAVVQALITLSILGLVIAWLERPGERRFPWSAGAAQANPARGNFGLIITLKELRRALSNGTTAKLLLIAAVYVMVEGLYDPLTVEFFVQHLDWSAARFATAQGTLGVTGELFGALAGGYLCDRYGRRLMAGLGMLSMATVLLLFGATSMFWEAAWYPHVLLLPAFKGTLAFTTVSMFSLFMKVCWTRAAATQFTLYMAMSNVGYALGAKWNSWIGLTGLDWGLAEFYLFGGALPLLSMLLLRGLDPDGIEARKQAEQRALEPS